MELASAACDAESARSWPTAALLSAAAPPRLHPQRRLVSRSDGARAAPETSFGAGAATDAAGSGGRGPAGAATLGNAAARCGRCGGAADDAGSARQWLAEQATRKTPTCRPRSRMMPVYSRTLERASILGATPPSSPATRAPPSPCAYERFLETHQLPGLDGLRGLAICPWFGTTPRRACCRVLGKGAVGVDLFFALSGFLITTLLLRERAPHRASCGVGAFYARRSLRLFPLYYLVLGFYALRALQTQADSAIARHFLHALPLHATYTSNWFLDYSVPHPVMFAFSWSLCVEEQFYWVWPGVVALVRSRAVLALLMGGAVVVDTLAEHAAFANYLPPGSLGLRMLTSFATPIGCGGFLALSSPPLALLSHTLLSCEGGACAAGRLRVLAESPGDPLPIAVAHPRGSGGRGRNSRG